MLGAKVAEIGAERRKRIDLHRHDTPVRDRRPCGRGRRGRAPARRRGRPPIRVEVHLTGRLSIARPRRPSRPRGEIAFDAEAAADIRRDHADLVLGNVQRVDREPAPQVVRLLGRRIKRVAIRRGVVVAEIGARLHRIGRQAAVGELELDHLGGRGHRGLGLAAIAALDLEHEIAAELLVHERRARRDRVARRGDRRQRLVVDRDRLGGLLGGEAGFRHHRGDDIADMADLVAREGRARRPFIGRPSPNGIGCTTVSSPWPARSQSSAVNVSSTPGTRGRGSVRSRRSAHGRAGCAQRRTTRCRADDIIDVAAPALNEAHILAPAQRLADIGVAAAALRALPRHP